MLFRYDCTHGCRGYGVKPPKLPGVDWPTPCPCEARECFSHYELGRKLEEDPRAIERVAEMRAGSVVSKRVLDKLIEHGLF